MHVFNSQYKRAYRFYGHSIIVHLRRRDWVEAVFLHNSFILESVSDTSDFESDWLQNSGNDGARWLLSRGGSSFNCKREYGTAGVGLPGCILLYIAEGQLCLEYMIKTLVPYLTRCTFYPPLYRPLDTLHTLGVQIMTSGARVFHGARALMLLFRAISTVYHSFAKTPFCKFSEWMQVTLLLLVHHLVMIICCQSRG